MIGGDKPVLDTKNTHDFYQTRLGRYAARVLKAKTRSFMSIKNTTELCNVVTYGHIFPFLSAQDYDQTRQIKCLSSKQLEIGVIPDMLKEKLIMCEHYGWPVEENWADKLFMAHALELTTQKSDLLREVWRILKPEAEAFLIVPNRSGLWARGDRNPFGQGMPFTRGQIITILEDHLFDIEAIEGALYLPPTQKRWMVKMAPAFDHIGSLALDTVAGVHCIRFKKRVAGTIHIGQKRQKIPLIPQTN